MGRRLFNYFLFIYAAALGAAPAPAATPVDQTNAQAVAEELNRRASDESMQNATTSAMRALLHFEQGEMPGAVSNGMTAYGKYRNSEDLDRLGDRNTLNRAMMGSLGGGSAVSAPKKTSTTFRRLDPGFLRQGEAGRVAAEFERRTGMKREDFLKELSDVSEKKISRNDPQLMEKVFARFEAFAHRIPNAEFRNHVLERVNKVPTTVRNGLVGKAIAKFAGLLAGGGEAPASAPAAASPPAGTAPRTAAGPASPPAGPEPTPGLSATPPAALPAAGSGGDGHTALLGNVINAAIRTQAEEPTIFDMITRQYRQRTPALTEKL